MSVSVERFVDDPIVTFVFADRLDSGTMEAFRQHKDELLQSMGAFYAILDVRSVPLPLDDVIATLDGDDAYNLAAEPRIRFTVLVQSDVQTSNDPTIFAVFEDKDEVLEYVHKDIASKAQGQVVT